MSRRKTPYHRGVLSNPLKVPGSLFAVLRRVAWRNKRSLSDLGKSCRISKEVFAVAEREDVAAKTLNKAQIVPEYPSDIRALPVIYSNHINVIGTPEEVLLEVSQLQPQNAKTGSQGTMGTLPAIVLARIVLTKGAAKRFASLLLVTLEKIQDMPEIEIDTQDSRNAR